MAEDYNQAGAAATTGMCGGGGSSGGGGGGNWWDAGRSMSRFDAAGGSSTCSSNSGTHYGWLAETVDVNARSSMESSSTTSSSAVFHGGDVTGHKQRLHGGGGAANSASNSSTSAMLLDPNLQIMGLGLSSQPLDCWTQPLPNHEKVAAEGISFRSMLQEESGLVFGNSPVELMKQGGGGVNINRGGFSLDHDHHDQFSSSNNSMESTVTCQGGGGLGSSTSNHNNNHHQVHSFPLDSSSISSIYGTTSPSALLLQGLMGGQACGAASPPAADHHHQQQQQLNYGYHQQQQNNNSYGLPISISNNNTDLMSSWSNNNKVHHQHHQQQVVPQFLRAPPDPSPKQTLVQNQLHFTNNAPFWNASASTGMTTHDSRPTSFFPSLHTQLPIPAFEDKPIKQNPLMEPRDTASTTATSASSMKKNDQTTATATKRGRNENNSSNMPTIKVRKEKMGDRITALQQLVSPFGKTDTASVLSEAIEYIKFLHEQVNVLSTPYLKSGNASYQHQQQHIDHHHKTKVDPDGPKQDLRSRGLCLVPVSSTFPVAHETSVDFGTPSTLGGFFR